MSKLKTHMQLHNKFELELYDSSGALKDKAYAYNVVTNYFWNFFFTSSVNSTVPYFRIIGIGTGTGTPSASDTSLFRFLASQDSTLVSFTKDYPTSTLIQKVTFPASSTIVGNVTEVGFVTSVNGSTCLTHALLQDAEGNTITIEKTDTDILVVTATLYINITAEELLELVPAESFGFLNTLRSTTYNGSYTLGSAYVSACPLFPMNSYIGTTGMAGNAAGDATTRSRTRGPVRILNTEGQRADVGTYVNYMYVGNFGGVKLPNTEFFPAYTLQPMSVGTGDGSTTEFVCPIPDFIEGTEEVKVNGVALTRGVDYTVDPRGNTAMNASSVNAHSNFAKGLSNGTKNSDARAHILGIASSAVHTYHGVFGKDVAPLVFDMGKDVECNVLFIDGLVFRYYSNSSSYNVTVVLEYSSNNSDWAEATRLTMQACSPSYIANITADNKNKAAYFNNTTARYWRLYIEPNSSSYVNNNGVGSAWGNSFFGKVGQGIVFTNPPAEGAAITISAAVDRPYKTSDYALDYSVSLFW